MNNNYHISFAESVIGKKLGSNSTTYLNEKFEFYQNEENYSDIEFFGRNVAHILKLPATVLGLTIQTVMDSTILLFAVVINMTTLGMSSNWRAELSARTYNLFVADSLTWLSIIPSIFFYTLYTGANSLHLGTVREIDFNKIKIMV